MILHLYEESRDFYRDTITPVQIIPPPWSLRGNGMFFIGSCFADYICREYQDAELNAMGSPFGNIYNPESLAEAAGMLSGDIEKVKPEDCFASDHDGGYRHFMFHSRLKGGSPEELAEVLNRRTTEARDFIAKSEAVVITLGTSLVYRLKSGHTVSNCHKLPATYFDRVQLNANEAATALAKTIAGFRRINSKLKIILNLSPIRHLRDNPAENSLSKAVLRCAIEEICADDEDCWYFPSFEIMLDELRDYKWYADDLCHPGEKAISFILSRFIQTAYNEDFHAFLNTYSRLLRDLNHKPFNPDSPEYKGFKADLDTRRKALEDDFPYMFRTSGK